MGRFRFVIPNAVTSANVLLGFLSILAAGSARFDLAVYLLVGAVILDMADGQVARRLRATSSFGQQMDSLCDCLSFCAAPALLAYWAVLEQLGWIGAAAAFVYLLSGVLRLARFNLCEDAHGKSQRIMGLPTPIGAGYLMAIGLMREQLPPVAAAIVVFVMAAAMISPIYFPAIKGKGPSVIAILVGVLNFIAVVIWPNWYTVAWWNLWNVVIVVIGALETRRLARTAAHPDPVES